MGKADDGVLRLRSDELAWRRVAGSIVVLDLRANSYLSINKSGILLWDLLVDGSTQAAMTSRLVSDFDIDLERARTDVEQFVRMLEGRELLA